MKKWIAAALALLLAVNMGIIRTDAAKEEKTRAVIDAAVVAPNLEKKPLYDNRAPASPGLTTDTVTIDEDTGVCTVVTASGTELSLTVPFGSCCVTQDVQQQLEIYMSLFGDISSALKYYISNGIHMDVFDYYTGTSTYIAESDDTLSALIGEINTLNSASTRQLASYLSDTWYGGAAAVTKTVGGNKYIAFDLTDDYGFVVFNHITNGKLIEIYSFCDNGPKGIQSVGTLLAELTFSPAEREEAEETEETEKPEAAGEIEEIEETEETEEIPETEETEATVEIEETEATGATVETEGTAPTAE